MGFQSRFSVASSTGESGALSLQSAQNPTAQLENSIRRCKPSRPSTGLHLRMQTQLLSKASGRPGKTDLAESVGPTQELDDFDSLVRRYRPRIFRFLLASLRDRESAENLTQDCFVRAYRARGQFRGAAHPGTWLMQIAANTLRNHVASGRLKFWRRALQKSSDLDDLHEWIPDRHASPEDLALAKEQLQAMWKAAGGLPERQRTVFLLRFVEDLNLLEIAAITGMKEGTVKAHLFRALQSVRARLEEGK
jgi:RNA polymerase sigma-70 factor, ECF subfamily